MAGAGAEILDKVVPEPKINNFGPQHCFYQSISIFNDYVHLLQYLSIFSLKTVPNFKKVRNLKIMWQAHILVQKTLESFAGLFDMKNMYCRSGSVRFRIDLPVPN